MNFVEWLMMMLIYLNFTKQHETSWIFIILILISNKILIEMSKG